MSIRAGPEARRGETRGRTTSLRRVVGAAGILEMTGRGSGRCLAVPRNAGKESLPEEGSGSCVRR